MQQVRMYYGSGTVCTKCHCSNASIPTYVIAVPERRRQTDRQTDGRHGIAALLERSIARPRAVKKWTVVIYTIILLWCYAWHLMLHYFIHLHNF